MTSQHLSVHTRAAELRAAVDTEFDVLVIGMGAGGAAIALDAASRGLTVCVVDRGDLASGTSGTLVHGGLRSYGTSSFGAARAEAAERALLQRLAPHLVHPLNVLAPVWPSSPRAVVRPADVLSLAAPGTRRRRLSAQQAGALAPALAGSGLTGADRYGDCTTDDARLVLAMVQAARAFGALAVTYADVSDVRRDDAGRVDGALLVDRLHGDELLLRARHVVQAIGSIQPERAVQLVLPKQRLPLDVTGVVLPGSPSLFALPWGGQTILGGRTTDAPPGTVGPTSDELAQVLAEANTALHPDGGALQLTDVLATWVDTQPRGAAADHGITEGSDALLSIADGSLTTYRRTAAEVVDRIVARDGRRAPSRTDRISLGGTRPAERLQAEITSAAAALGLDADTAVALVRQSGEQAADVLSLVAADPTLGRQLSPDAPHIAAEVVYAARAEGAVTLDDVFRRRMRLSLRSRDASLPAARFAADLLAAETGRDAAWAHAQVLAYAEGVRRERGALGVELVLPSGAALAPAR